MSMRLTKKIIAMCFAVGMTLMPMGQAFANEEGETLVETTTLMTHEGENSFIYKSRAGKPTVLTMG